jgi:hypothetical protein
MSIVQQHYKVGIKTELFYADSESELIKARGLQHSWPQNCSALNGLRCFHHILPSPFSPFA